MAMQRNIIANYPAKLRRDIALWLADGEGPKRIRERLQKLGVSPLPHNTSFRAYRGSPEYRKIYERQLEMSADVAQAETDWKIAESAGANGYAATAVFETLRDLRDEYKACEDVGEKIGVAKMIDRICRTFGGSETEKLRENDRAWKRRFKELTEQKNAEAEARILALEQENDALRADNAKLRAALEARQGSVDPAKRSEIIDAVDEFVGKQK